VDNVDNIRRVSPALKYTLGRIGLFAVVAAVLFVLPITLHPLLRLMIAVLVSAVLALVLLRRWRDEVAVQISTAARRRAEAKERLRSALAGDEEGTDNNR
jgi:membrane protein implicated in regulation of membrane protease activity